MEEDRTKALQTALETIWKKMDPASPLFDRYPFVAGRPVIPVRPRGKHGRDVSAKIEHSESEEADNNLPDHFSN